MSEIKALSEEQIMREFATTEPSLKEMLKRVLYIEGRLRPRKE